MESTSLNEALSLLISDKHQKRDLIEEKTGSYSALACSLKSVSSNAPIPEAIFNHRNKLIDCILTDVSEGDSVSPFALQALGYILFNELVARCIDEEMATKIVTALLKVTNDESSTKQMCTRALWCLANQNLQNSVILPHVSRIVASIKKMTSNPLLQTSSVAFEALSVLQKLHSQSKAEFLVMIEAWYSVLMYMLLSKQVKVQVKALEFAEVVEDSLKENSELPHWLHRELRKNILPYVNSLMNSKVIDAERLMRVWMHFVKILGKTLHKSGSFLNEMLKIVESGFKNRFLVVQIAAYKAWNVLIDDFALDKEVFMNQKRLRLLLMPLVGSAVKQRTVEVDHARISTWWHLITELLPICPSDIRTEIFSLVCTPFLLFCLGLDPKNDLSNPSSSSDHASFPTPLHLFTQFSQPNPSKPSSHYPFSPSAQLVRSGCAALLMFLKRDHLEIEGSIIQTGSCDVTLYSFPIHMLHAFLVFVEGCLHNQDLLPHSLLILVAHCVIRKVFMTIGDRASPDPYPDDKMAVFGASDLMFRMKNNFELVQLTGLINECSGLVPYMTGSLVEAWPNVLTLALRLIFVHSAILRDFDKRNAKTLCLDIIAKVTKEVGWSKQDVQLLGEAYSFIVQCMDYQLSNGEFHVGDGDQILPYQIWTKVAKLYTEFLVTIKTYEEGVNVDAGIKTIRSLLSFPFKHGFIQNGKILFSAIVKVWKALLYAARVYVRFVAKDPNLLTRLVSEDFLGILKNFMSQITVKELSDVYQPDKYLEHTLEAVSVLLDVLMSQHDNLFPKILPSLKVVGLIIEQCLKEMLKTPAGATPILVSPVTALSCVTTLYNLLSMDEGIVQLSKILIVPLSDVIRKALKEKGGQEWKKTFFDAVRVTWRTICSCFRTVYKGGYRTETLVLLSPLLEVLLVCKIEGIISDTVYFWCTTFANSQDLTLPYSLRLAFTRFKKSFKSHVHIPIPGFVPIPDQEISNVSCSIPPTTPPPDPVVIEDSEPAVVLPLPCSSTTPLKHNFTSPQKRKEGGAKETGPVSKKLSLNDQEYVLIEPSSSKEPRKLTEHQKEKRRERPEIPPMYTSVEPSLSTQPFLLDEESQQSTDSCSTQPSSRETDSQSTQPSSKGTDSNTTHPVSSGIDLHSSQPGSKETDSHSTQPGSKETLEKESQPSQIPESPPVRNEETVGNSEITTTSELMVTSSEQPQTSGSVSTEPFTAPTSEDSSERPTSEGIVDLTYPPPDLDQGSGPDPGPIITSGSACILTVPVPVPFGSIEISATSTDNNQSAKCEIPLDRMPNIFSPSPSVQNDTTETSKEVDQTPPIESQATPCQQLGSNSETDSSVPVLPSESAKSTTKRKKRDEPDAADTPAPVGNKRKRKKDGDNDPEDRPTLRRKRAKRQSTNMPEEESQQTPLAKRRKRGTPKQVVKMSSSTDPHVVMIDSPVLPSDEQTTPTLNEEPPARKRRKAKEKNQSPPSADPKQTPASPFQLPSGCQIQVPPGANITKEQLNVAIQAHLRSALSVISPPSTNPLLSSATSPEASSSKTGNVLYTCNLYSDIVAKLMQQQVRPPNTTQQPLTTTSSAGATSIPLPGQVATNQIQTNPMLNNQGFVANGNQPQTSNKVPTRQSTSATQTSSIQAAEPVGGTEPPSSFIASPLPTGVTLSQIGGQVGTSSLMENIKLLKAFLNTRSTTPFVTGSLPMPRTSLSSNTMVTSPAQGDSEDPLPTTSTGLGRESLKTNSKGVEEGGDSAASTVSSAIAAVGMDKPSEQEDKEPEHVHVGGSRDKVGLPGSHLTTVDPSERVVLSLKPSQDGSNTSTPQKSVECGSSNETESDLSQPVNEGSGHGELCKSMDVGANQYTVVLQDNGNSEDANEIVANDRMEANVASTDSLKIVSQTEGIVQSISGPSTECDVSGSLTEGLVQSISGSNTQANTSIYAEDLGCNISGSNTEGNISGSHTEMEVCPNPSVPSLAHIASVVVAEIDKDAEKQTTSFPNLPRLKSLPPLAACGSQMGGTPNTPPPHLQDDTSPKQTPIGILKHISQFDTPISATKGRRVQFASPIVMGKQDAPPNSAGNKEDSLRGTKSSRSRRKSPLSSRRTLQLTGPFSGVTMTTPTSTKGDGVTNLQTIVFPSLRSCQSPVEQILPALSPSGKFSHGLYNVIHARNISTVGNLSSLTENEVNNLPIKSPKVPILRNALRNFEVKMMQGQRKRPLSKDEGSLVPKQLHLDDSSHEEDPLLMLNTPNSQVTTCTPDDQVTLVDDHMAPTDDHVTNDQASSIDDNGAKGNELEDVQPMEGEESMGGTNVPPVADKESGGLEDEPSGDIVEKNESGDSGVPSKGAIEAGSVSETNELSEDRRDPLDQSSSVISHDHTYSQQSPCSSPPTNPVTVTGHTMLTSTSHLESQDLFPLTGSSSGPNPEDDVPMEMAIALGVDKETDVSVKETDKSSEQSFSRESESKKDPKKEVAVSNELATELHVHVDTTGSVSTDMQDDNETDEPPEENSISAPDAVSDKEGSSSDSGLVSDRDGSSSDSGLANSVESDRGEQSLITSFTQVVKDMIEDLRKHSNTMQIDKNELDDLLEQSFGLTRAVYSLNGR